MRDEMVQSLNRRFGNIESNETLVLATMLDPCFKDKIFSGVAERDAAKSMLVDKSTRYYHNQDNPRRKNYQWSHLKNARKLQ